MNGTGKVTTPIGGTGGGGNYTGVKFGMDKNFQRKTNPKMITDALKV